MRKKSRVRQKFDAMERFMRRVRQPRYKGLNFSLEQPSNGMPGSLYLYFSQDGAGAVGFEFHTSGRHIKCDRVYDDLKPSQAKVSQRVYKAFEKFHRIFVEFGGKA